MQNTDPTPHPPLYVMWIADGDFWIAEEHPFAGATKYIPETQPEVLTTEQLQDRLSTLEAIARSEAPHE